MLSKIEVTGKKDTRSGFGDGIVEAARNRIWRWHCRSCPQQ